MAEMSNSFENMEPGSIRVVKAGPPRIVRKMDVLMMPAGTLSLEAEREVIRSLLDIGTKHWAIQYVLPKFSSPMTYFTDYGRTKMRNYLVGSGTGKRYDLICNMDSDAYDDRHIVIDHEKVFNTMNPDLYDAIIVQASQIVEHEYGNPAEGLYGFGVSRYPDYERARRLDEAAKFSWSNPSGYHRLEWNHRYLNPAEDFARVEGLSNECVFYVSGLYRDPNNDRHVPIDDLRRQFAEIYDLGGRRVICWMDCRFPTYLESARLVLKAAGSIPVLSPTT